MSDERHLESVDADTPFEQKLVRGFEATRFVEDEGWRNFVSAGKNGFYFRRLASGVLVPGPVMIAVRKSEALPTVRDLLCSVLLPEDEWSSIVDQLAAPLDGESP